MSTETYLPYITLALLCVYHVTLSIMIRRAPQKTHQGRSNELRFTWTQNVMHKHADILAIQTLRNWTMAATFLASTAIIIAFGTLNLLMTTESSPGHLASISSADNLWSIKLLLIATNFIFAFFHFTLAIRSYNHAGFLLNLPSTETLLQSVQISANTVNKGARHYTVGMRHYYLSVPLICWLFGAQLLMISTLVLLLMLYYLDYHN